MGMVARQLADAILEGREDPKEFFRRHIAKRPPPIKPPPPVMTGNPQEDWLDWDDLEDWQRTAAMEMFAELGEIALERYTDEAMDVATDRNHDYRVYENDDAAERIAIAEVKDQLNDEPGLFTQDWLERFINLERLRDTLYQDARDDDYWNDQYPTEEDKLNFLVEQDKLDRDDFLDAEGNELQQGEFTPEMEQAIESAFEDHIESNAKERVEDPIAYLEEFENHEDAVKRAIDMVGINDQEAAEDAVSTDGWQHFLARYDGESHDLPSGAVYVRV